MSSGKKSKKAARIRDKNRNHVRRPDSLRGVRPDKRLGQNFLIDEDVIAAIIDESSVSGDTLVIEIGPGTGALTLPLAERAGRVIAIELDDEDRAAIAALPKDQRFVDPAFAPEWD